MPQLLSPVVVLIVYNNVPVKFITTQPLVGVKLLVGAPEPPLATGQPHASVPALLSVGWDVSSLRRVTWPWNMLA